jgi:toxin ParE1/3/4
MSAKPGGYRLSPRALQDLEEIWLYTFQQWSATQANSYVSDILSACKGLVSGEKIGMNAEDIRNGYWKYFNGSHSIYYKFTGQHLDVMRILHQSRDVKTHLSEE